MADIFEVEAARQAFPAVHHGDQIFFDNAGGSQILRSVSVSIQKYLEETNVQLGAGYDISKKSTQAFGGGLKAAAAFINASADETGIGPRNLLQRIKKGSCGF